MTTRPPRMTPDPGFKLCHTCDGSRECPYCGGRGQIKGSPCPMCDYGTCPTCEGEGQLPESWKEPEPEPDTITFEQGHETAPDSPWGFQRVRVSTDGSLEYENRSKAGTRVLRGTIDGERVRTIRQAFSRTTFPQKPQEKFRPGSSIIRLTTTPPTYSVLIDYFEGMKMDGYRDIIRDLSELNNALREDNKEALSTWHFERAPEVGQ